MYLDVVIKPSLLGHLFGAGFISVCLLVMWQAGLVWWQLALTFGVGVVVLALNLTKPVVIGISTKDPAQLWEFAIRRGGEVELWQGYVNNVTMQAGRVILDIYVSEPHSERMKVSIGRGDMEVEDYRRLSALAYVGRLDQN